MILPTKYISHDRALIGIGGEILKNLEEPRTVSTLWECVRNEQIKTRKEIPITFDWFILALNLLYAVSAVEYRNGVLHRKVAR